MNAILVGIVATFAVGGVWKGGMKTIFSLLSFAVAFLVSYFCFNKLADLFFAKDFLRGPLTNVVNDILGGINGDLLEQKFSSSSDMSLWVAELDMPYYAKNILLAAIKDISFEGNFSVAQVVANPLYKTALQVISFVIIFVFSFVLLKILQYFLQKMLNFSFFKVTDKVAGFLMGIAFGVAVYFAFVYVLLQISHVLLSDFIIEKINEGYLSSIFYSYLTK